MARPKSNVLYRKANAGTWRYHKPGFGIVDTGEVDKFMADQKMRGRPTVPVESDTPESPAVEVDPIRAALNKIADVAAEPPKPEPSKSEPEKPKALIADLLTPKQSDEDARASKSKERIKKKLSGKRLERVIKVAVDGVSRINALAVEFGFRVIGRKLPDDYIVPEEDMEWMSLGYELIAEDILENLDLKPWHVVILGNVFLAVAMLPNLEKVKKQVKPVGGPPTDGGPPDA